MKNIFKTIIFKILELEARVVLVRFKPKIIAISGTVGKTTTKDMIYWGLKDAVKVRKNYKSMNSEIGVPLTILDLKTGWNDPKAWLKNICIGFWRMIHNPEFPEWLVLETGIDRPGDMKKLTSWLKPDIAVITALGKVPAHVEYFESPEKVMAEEGSLVFAVKENGAVILNADDENVLKLKSKLEVRTYTYSLINKSDVMASNYEIVYEDHKPAGVVYKVNYDGNVIPVKINGAIGEPVVYSSLPAICAAIFMDISILKVGESFSNYEPTPGRMNVINGEDGAVIIDDSYNASPLAVQSALNVLNELRVHHGAKKIAVLGDMLELGKFSAKEHRGIGELIASLKIDILVTVGFRAEAIAEEAHKNGFPINKIFTFRESVDAISKCMEFLKEGNIILVKGSQGARMEKIVRELVADDVDVMNRLVRQESAWEDR